jgi:hypothetical protein
MGFAFRYVIRWDCLGDQLYLEGQIRQ